MAPTGGKGPIPSGAGVVAVAVAGSGAVSRPSETNCHGPREDLTRANREVDPDDVPNGAGLRPLSVEPGRRLRDEARLVEMPSGERYPADRIDEVPDGAESQARPWYRVIDAWRDWYDGYRRSHIEYESTDGETARAALRNSYQPEYGDQYYAKLKDLERGVQREYDGLTTVMLTLTASTENANGNPRCPADHLRDVIDGYDAARKMVHKALSGRNWCYARVVEPHRSGYGHVHMAIFVEDPDGSISGEDFRPSLRSHVENCPPAGSEAHGLGAEGQLEDSVSVSEDVQDLACYISEYIGQYGEEPTERDMAEQAFYATAWATGTRRVDFSQSAQDLMDREQYRRETGLKPDDRGGEDFERWKAGEGPDGTEDGATWNVSAICTVSSRRPKYSDPTTGGVAGGPIDGRPGADPPPIRQ